MAGVQYRGNQRMQPPFLADFFEEQMLEHFPAKLDNTGVFTGRYGVKVKLNGAAIQGATSITVDALALPQPATSPTQSLSQQLIPSGTILDFGGAKFAVLAEDANQGETVLDVRALPTAIADDDEAYYSKSGGILVPAGTPVGWTYSERNTAPAYLGPWAPGDDEIFLTAYTVTNLVKDNNVELFRANYAIGIKENYLPGYADMLADVGVANPSVAPTLGHTGSDGSAGAGAYDVGYTFSTLYGETKLSPVASVTKLTTEHITIADIAFPTNATGINFYASVQPASHVLGWAKSLAAHAATTLIVDGIGGSPPTANGSKGTSGKALDAIRAAYRTLRGEGL